MQSFQALNERLEAIVNEIKYSNADKKRIKFLLKEKEELELTLRIYLEINKEAERLVNILRKRYLVVKRADLKT